MSDVELFPGARLSPTVHLHMLLENMDDCKGVIVLKIDHNGAVDITTSCVSISEMALAAMRFQSFASRTIDGDPPDGTQIISEGEPA